MAVDGRGSALEVEEVGSAPRRAVEYLLHTARRYLDMEATFLARVSETTHLIRAATGDAGSFSVFEGGEMPSIETYCRYVVESDAPWVVQDTSQDERARRLAITATARFGAYIGVPVHLPDGRPFGTLCCLSHVARPELGDRDVAVMEVLADVLAFHVVQLEESTARIEELEERTGDLATEVRRAELQLGMFAEIVAASQVPTLVLDPEKLRVDFANQAAVQLLAGDAADAVGAALWDLLPAPENEVRSLLAPVLQASSEALRFERAADAQLPALDVLVQRITGAGGDTVLLWTALDITERREAQRQLERALEREQQASAELRRLDQLRNTFLTAVSHELRTPLTAVRGASETLRTREVPADLADRLLDRLMVNADRLDRLLSDLLDLNQFIHGEIRVRRERVRLDELVRRAVDELELDPPGPVLALEPIEAEVAPTKIERIVVNLVANAAIHTPEGTAVEVRLIGEEDGALLVVSDEGAGIDPEDRGAVFEPFWQGRTAPAHRPGTGIGLSLVAAFTQLHGGRVWVEETLEGGAAFHVWLPRVPD